MGGLAIAAVGYELPEDALSAYQSRESLPEQGPTSTKHLLRHLESVTHSPLALARYDDDEGKTHKVLCCHVQVQCGAQTSDASPVLEEPVPSSFEAVKDLFAVGDLKRVLIPKAMLFSFYEDGKTRIKEDGLQF